MLKKTSIKFNVKYYFFYYFKNYFLKKGIWNYYLIFIYILGSLEKFHLIGRSFQKFLTSICVKIIGRTKLW